MNELVWIQLSANFAKKNIFKNYFLNLNWVLNLEDESKQIS